ncbi:MAG: hypothetical protein EZS28_006836 [Streblomastix strix]|uniref:Uncharacterized protein n=1 Tax=Streblomastix strix TaxID=222440 RepID=A0A5J4WU15_9EUKA|nr:MAG: hypothetical protein EZS28_006836 [Streblomastix strix]
MDDSTQIIAQLSNQEEIPGFSQVVFSKASQNVLSWISTVKQVVTSKQVPQPWIFSISQQSLLEGKK